MPEEALSKPLRFSLLDHAAAMVAGLIALVVYIYLLPTSITGEDAGELAAAAYVLGVPHPPGYPLWCLLAHGFTWIPLYTVAWRVALCSAVFGAATVYVLSLLCTRLSGSRLASVLASLALAFSFDFLGQATIPEVYTLNTFLTVWCWLLLALWHEQRSDKLLCALAVVHGLSLANHNTAIVLSPLFALFVVLVERQPLKRAPVYVALAAASLVVAFVLYCYLPLRSLANPPVDWGNPETLSNWWRHVTRGQYAFMLTEEPRSWGRFTSYVSSQVEGWMFLRDEFPQFSNYSLLTVGALGIPFLLWTRRLVPFAILCFGVSLSLVSTLIQNPDATREWLTVMRVFHLPLFMALAVGMANLLGALHRLLLHFLVKFIAFPIVIALFVSMNMIQLREEDGQKYDRKAVQVYATMALTSLPPDAILVPHADHQAFPLQYLQVVEGVRPDVTLARKYGYVDMALFPQELREKWGEFPPRRAEPELFTWLIEHTDCPLYFFKRPSVSLTDVSWESCWMLESAVQPGEEASLEECASIQRGFWRSQHIAELFICDVYTFDVIEMERYFKRAEQVYEEGDRFRTYDYVRSALEVYGRDSKSLYNAGVFYARRDEYEQARIYFEDALAFDPEHKPSLEAIARLEGMGH